MAIKLDEDNKVVVYENEPEDPRSMFPNIPAAGTIEGDVGDVLINGTSIVDENGDADIPVMASDKYGVAKINSTLGIAIANGNLAVVQSYLSNIKAGVDQYRPIVPQHQHESVFYGLSKAAGDTTQALSDNAVGTYTDEAKIAIQKMLGIYEAPWELIRGDSFTNEAEADYTIDVDLNNSPFELTDIYIEVWLEATTNPASAGGNGVVQFYYDNANYLAQSFGSAAVQVGGNALGCWAIIKSSKGGIYRENSAYNTFGAIKNYITTPNGVNTNRSFFVALNTIFNKIVIKQITGKMSYRLYGKRKWT